MKKFKGLMLFLILISCVIMFCVLMPQSVDIANAAEASTGKISETYIYNNIPCYNGSTYYHYVNLRVLEQDGTKENKTYYTKNSIKLQYSRGSHNTGGGLSADGGDTAGWLHFMLYDDNGELVKQLDFYQKYYADTIKDGKDTANVWFEHLNSGTYHLKVNTHYYRSSDWKQTHNTDIDAVFVVDSTVPSLSIISDDNKQLKSGEATNKGFEVTGVDDNFAELYYKQPNGDLKKATTNSYRIDNKSKNGTYEFYAYDKSGNKSSVYTVVLDTEAPTITLSGGLSISGNKHVYEKYSNTTVKVEYSDNHNVKMAKYTVGVINAEDLNSGDEFFMEGEYFIYVDDYAGNYTSYQFTIDATAPTITLSGGLTISGNVNVSDKYANSPVKVDFNDKYIDTAKYKFENGSEELLTKGTTFSEEGNYTIVVTDKSQNSTTYQFIIDTTAPTVTLSGGLSISGNEHVSYKYTNSSVKVEFSDVNLDADACYYTDNSDVSKQLTSGQTLKAQDNEAITYIISVKDKAGNSTVYLFIIDTIKPILKCDIANGGFTNSTFTVKALDTYSFKIYYKTADSTSYVETTRMQYTVSVGKDTPNGMYSFYAVDRAGNRSADYIVYVDNIAPTLVGVVDGGFYKNFTAKWDSTSLLNSHDIIKAEYSVLTSGQYPTTVSTEFSSNRSFTDDGNYLIRLTDLAGNSKDYRITVDNSAPTLSLTGLNSSNFANDKVSATWATTIGGVSKPRMNANDILTVTYAKSNESAYPTAAQATTNYSSALTAEGNYTIKIADKAGNYTSYQFTIDKTAPTLTLNGLVSGLSYYGSKDGFYATWTTTVGGVGAQLANANDKLTANYSINSKQYPTSASTSYARNTTLSAEGYYLLTLSDLAGNTNTYKIVIDKTAPTVSKIAEYLNSEFTFTATDKHNATIIYTFNGSAEVKSNKGSVKVALNEKNYGIWTFWAIDELGNRSTTQTIKLFYRDDFGNLENIKNGYKVSTWFTVSLPNRIYTTIAGNYSFRTQEDALNFAIAKEWDYRVEKLENGWSYVNISNESVSQIYTVRADLDAAILKYASSYISERKEMQLGANTYPNPTDNNGVVREDALTQQSIKYPDILSAYSNLPLYLIRHDFKFARPIAGVTGNTRKVQLKFIANDYSLSDGALINAEYDKTIEAVLTSEGAYMQGYYLVEESDLCGNTQRYVVYIDNDTPVLTATATYGDETQNLVRFTNEYIIKNEGVMLYVKLELQSLFDNIDEYVMICISGRGFNDKVYVLGDELPTLAFENGFYGRYTINVYDRSFNYISFEIRIAGENAYVSNTSLTNETRCTLTVNYDSANNGITEIHIFKVSYTGEYSELLSDSDGTPISAAVMSYILRVGGKYVVRFADIFGRVIETEPIFYMKGLPSGTLRGVREGGITNQDVSFEFSEGKAVFLYAYINQQWVRHDDVLSITEKEGYSIASITANADTSLIYKFFLFIENDMNLFTEYRFEIDCIAPCVVISTTDGDVLEQETVTNSSFSVNWDEANVSARYYNKNDSLGSYGETTYSKRTVITKAGTYVFTVKDAVGNITEFTITLDNLVTYSIEGNYSVLEDGSYISKTNMTLTVTERTSQFNCISTNGINIVNGGTISEDGTYRFEITDAVGNSIIIVIIIDKLPPIPIIKTASGNVLEMNSATRESFTVNCEEANVTFVMNNTMYSGAELSQEGVYAFRLTDRMNNSISFTITIDLTVKYSVNGNYSLLEDGSYISRYNFIVNVNEDYSVFNVENEKGLIFAPNEKIAQEGTYIITIVDVVGNEVKFTLILDMTPPMPTIQSEDGTAIKNGKTNKPFIVLCSEPGSKLKVATTSTSSGSVYMGEPLAENGIYYFHLSDFIGNETIFTVEIDTVVRYTLNGTYKTTDSGAFISKTGISISVNEEYEQFAVFNSQGELLFISVDEKITQEDIYHIQIKDMAGNIAEFEVIIDLTSPEYKITSISEKSVAANEIINEGFSVNCEEAKTSIMFSMNGLRYASYDGSVCSVAGTYYFIISDFIGNEAMFTVTIDLGISYSVKGTYVQYGNTYASRTSLSIELDEELMRFDVESNNGFTFNAGDTVTLEGEYTVSIADIAGNTIKLVLVIDRTAPQPIISTVSGNAIAMNSFVNEGFAVHCYEPNSNITYSTNGIKYVEYHSSDLLEEGTYSFIVTDYVGNETAFSVTVDYHVDFIIKGTYVQIDDTYTSRSELSVQLNEEVQKYDIVSESAASRNIGDAISIEGVYSVTITDIAGNTVEFVLIIDRTAPTITIKSLDETRAIEPNSTTNKPFTVSTNEGSAIITYSTNGTKYEVYSGAPLDAEKTYYFVATDYVGNSVKFNVTLDMTVSYVIKGSFENDGEIVVSKYGVSIQVDEAYQTFTVNGGINESVISGERITIEGEYAIRIVDLFGNIADLLIIIDRTAPTITANVEDGGKTKDIVTIEVSDAKRAYYKTATGEIVEISDICQISNGGKYTVTAVDVAGNESTYTFTIDDGVDIRISPMIVNGQILTGSVRFEFGETVSTILRHNGDEIPFTSTINECGEYELVIADELGNISDIFWSIIPSTANHYDLTIPSDFTVRGYKDGNPFAVDSSIAQLNQDGHYSFVFLSKTGEEFTLELTVDTVPPSLTITQEKNQVVFSTADKNNVTYELYKDGELVSCTPNKAITDRGKYELIVTDELGNINHYYFELDYINVYGIVVIVVAIIVLLTVVIGVVIYRKKQTIR